MVNGFSGTFYTFSFTNYALMSDVTPENKQRSFLMTVFGALLGLGITCSQIIIIGPTNIITGIETPYSESLKYHVQLAAYS
jgi:hypothetical protein